jgi:hypothetical protein
VVADAFAAGVQAVIEGFRIALGRWLGADP